MALPWKGPEPEPKKLLVRLVLIGAGKSFKIFTATGDNRVTGIRLPANGVRPAPVLGFPVLGSKTCPVPLGTLPEVCA